MRIMIIISIGDDLMVILDLARQYFEFQEMF